MSEEIKQVLKDELENFKKNLPEYASKEDVQSALDAIEEKGNGISEIQKSVDELREVAEKQGMELQKFNKGEENNKGLDELLAEKHEEIKQVKANQSGRVRIELPAYKTDVTRSSVTSHTLAMRLPGPGS